MSNIERGFKGVWIPAELWLDENLSKIEMLFLTEIDSLDNESGCFAGNEWFEGFFRLSKSRCSEIIGSLKDKNYIKIQYEYEGKQIVKRIIKCINKYKNQAPLRKTEAKKPGTPSENRRTPSENTKDINTVNNTENPSISDEIDLKQTETKKIDNSENINTSLGNVKKTDKNEHTIDRIVDDNKTKKYGSPDHTKIKKFDDNIHYVDQTVKNDDKKDIEFVNEPVKEKSLNIRIKEIFDLTYYDIYGENFSWGKKGAMIGKFVNEIIAHSGFGTDDERLQKIEGKMSIMRWFCETDTKSPKFWKFSYAILSTKWNELVIHADPNIKDYENLIRLWNKLTGQEMELTPGLTQLMSVAKYRHNLEILKKAVLAKAVNKFDVDNHTQNLSTLLIDSKGQITVYAGKYDSDKLNHVVKKKLELTHDTHSPFPKIDETSDINQLKKFDWLQFGHAELRKYVIGDAGYKRLKAGENILTLIEEVQRQKLHEYIDKTDRELNKNIGDNHGRIAKENNARI